MTVTAFFGVLFLSVAIAGFFKRKMLLWERFLMGVAGSTLIHGSFVTDAVGFGFGGGLMVVSYMLGRRQALRGQGT